MANIQKFNSLNISLNINTDFEKSSAPQNADKIKCSVCGGTGVVFDAEGNTHPCLCWKQKQNAKKFIDANIPRALRNMTFANFDLSYYPANEFPNLNLGTPVSYLTYAKKAKKYAEDFACQIIDNTKTVGQAGLLLQGQVGSGKTHLAAAVANKLIAANKQVLFLVVPDFLDEIRMSYGNLGEFNEMELMNKAKNAAVLILDDLGAHNFSDWTRNKLFTLINYRINSELPMIITTNLHMDQLRDILGERIISRIISACKPCLLPVKRDIRLSKLHK